MWGNCNQSVPTMWGPPVVSWFRFTPWILARYLRTINHSETGVMCTNWTLSWPGAPHCMAIEQSFPMAWSLRSPNDPCELRASFRSAVCPSVSRIRWARRFWPHGPGGWHLIVWEWGLPSGQRKNSLRTGKSPFLVDLKEETTTGVGKCPNWTSPKYWGYNFQQIFEGDVQYTQNGTFNNPWTINGNFL